MLNSTSTAKDFKNRMSQAGKSTSTVVNSTVTNMTLSGPNGEIYVPKQFIMLKCKNIYIAKVYQRIIDKKRVANIQKEYKTELYTPIKVYQRKDGTYYLVDGQHRIMAHMALFGEDSIIQVELIQRVTPFFKNMTDEEFEAWVFEHQYDNTSRLNKQELIRAAIAANEPFAVDMCNIVSRYGFTINLNNSASADNKPACAATLMRIYSGEYGALVLDELMKICKDAFNGEKKAFSKPFLEYTALFLRKVIKNTDYNHNTFVDRLQKFSNGNIKTIESAVEVTNVKIAKDVREALVYDQYKKIYNYKRKTNLLK